MEKDIGKLQKNDNTDIVVRVDDFGGKTGLTIREYVTSDRYTGFTKAGVRITAENFPKFKEMVNSISEDDLKAAESDNSGSGSGSENVNAQPEKPGSGSNEELPDY